MVWSIHPKTLNESSKAFLDNKQMRRIISLGQESRTQIYQRATFEKNCSTGHSLIEKAFVGHNLQEKPLKIS